VAVVRISGPDAFTAVQALTGRGAPGRTALLRQLCNPSDDAILDEALVRGFAGPARFTGEDVAELQLHGSPAVCRGVLAALGAMPGLRQAEPGEFTRRALTSGRLDLAQVEGLAGLIEAETEAQQRQAMQLMLGALSRQAAGWRERLVRALAFLEATIDFADEELPANLTVEVRSELASVAEDMAAVLSGSRIAERLRDGFEVALVGAPNVGKSTLLNALAGRDVALTSEVAGTTRDVIEVRMDLDGLPVTLLDLAGMRETTETVESLGIAKARERAERADLRVFLVEGDSDIPKGVGRVDGDLTVQAKSDLLGCGRGLAVSGRTGVGIDRLLHAMASELGERASSATTVSTARQRNAIERARAAVLDANAELDEIATQPEVAAAELQRALRALDFLVGKVDVEAVLDVVFQSFCLGK
jgi:tRNA modification GTPase